MDLTRYFDAAVWMALPVQFWAIAFFIFGCIFGSFLNVCIHRLPRGESLISPPSHCPHCQYGIPWYLNVPLITWIYLGGRCANCRAPISPRYFLVELLTGLLFLAAWLIVGKVSVGLTLIYCLFFAGLIAATFIDVEHFIIPDEITLGGIVAGFIASFFVPGLQGVTSAKPALFQSFLGIVVGGGVVYLILRAGKIFFGRRQLELAPHSKVVFTENSLVLPDQEIPYEDIFYRKTDTIQAEAHRLELVDRCYISPVVRLMPDKLFINDEQLNPEEVPYMEITTDAIVLPREAMGLGDVKFMAAIGAFLGWQATIYSLMVSSIIGAVVGVTLILLKKQEWSSRLPYGPYIALAAMTWIFGGHHLVKWWLSGGFFQ